MNKKIGSFFLLALFLLSACASPTPPAPATVTPAPPTPIPATATSPAPQTDFLRVQGRDILDSNGQPVYLRGVNVHTSYYSYLWDPTAPWTYATQEDIEYLDSLGVTAIRLGFHWRYFDTSLGFDLIDAYLDWCEEAGIYVILDMHVVPPEEDILEGNMWDDPAAQQKFLDLWTQIAARYKDRAIIAGYDPYNEPAPSDAAQWWDLVERAIAAIRAVDENHILFVENPLSDDDRFTLLADPNVVYSFHTYDPFVVSHAGANWVGDSPMPDGYSYPGEILTGTEWADYSADAAIFTEQTNQWLYWDSGVLTAPAGVEFATLKTSVSGNTGEVWFDDLELLHNGEPQTVFNPSMETESTVFAGELANWYFWTDSSVTGDWSDEAAHSGAHSLKLTGDGAGFGIWTQSYWIFTEPLFRFQPGDTFQARGWILAPNNNGGSITLELDYLNGVYETYDLQSLRAEMQPHLDWAAANNVPLFVGEFGAMTSASGDSRYNLIADMISVMNEAGLHWTMWAYKDGEPPTFGLYLGDTLDERLADILRQGFGE